MASRIELELTSDRGDGSWTWRAAGAKQPKGILDGSLLPDGAKVGDILKGEAEMEIDGMEVVSILNNKRERTSPELLEILGPQRKEELVTTQLVKGRRGDRDGRGGGRGRGGDRGGRGGDRGGRGGDRGGRGRGGDRRDTPKAPRLRPQRTHRNAWLNALPAEQLPIGEQMLQGGVPAVREALDAQNAQARANGTPEVAPDAIVSLAETLLPAMKGAEWRDRAEAALQDVDQADLRDLRSVIVAADTGARDDETRQMAEQLRGKLNERIDRDHAAWLKDLSSTLQEGRTVRALRQSSRPVKAGAPLPQDVATSLVTAANEALASDVEPSRWAAVLDAVAFSPVRTLVQPAGLPDEADDEVTQTVTKLANRVPQIAALFGITPAPQERRRRPKKGGDNKSAEGKATEGKAAEAKPAADPAPADAPADSAPADDAGAETPEAPAVAAEAPEAALEPGEQVITETPESDDAPAPVPAASGSEEE